MFPVRRAAVPVSRLLRRQQPRRLESSSTTSHSGHGEHGEHGEHGHHSGPVNESFGPGFYIALSSIPIGLALYKLSTSDASSKPWLTTLIESWSYKESDWERRNALHTLALERAAQDRHFFESHASDVEIDLSFPEVFNMGSPINVSPGRGSGDLRAVAAHYERRNRLTEEKRLAKLKDGKVVSIYDDERLF